MEWFLIHAIGPFFRAYERKRINWSKIPFPHLETLDEAGWCGSGIEQARWSGVES
jgi:hypothetical protein